MIKLLLNVDYTDDSKKFWRHSYIKNKIVVLEDGQSVHDLIKTVIQDQDNVTVSYNGQPQSNVYRDTKDGEEEAVGYIYRAKDEIDGKQALFDVWVTIKKVEQYPIDILD